MTRRINHTVLITAACFAAVFSCAPSTAQSEIFHGGHQGIWGDFDRQEILGAGISKHSSTRLIIYRQLHSTDRATIWVKDIFKSPDSHKNKICEIVGYLVVKPDDIRLYETEEKYKKNQESDYLKIKFTSCLTSKEEGKTSSNADNKGPTESKEQELPSLDYVRIAGKFDGKDAIKIGKIRIREVPSPFPDPFVHMSRPAPEIMKPVEVQ